MSTNPIGPDKTNLTINVPRPMRDDLEKLAQRSGMKLGALCRAVLAEALEEGVEFEQVLLRKKNEISYTDKAAEPSARYSRRKRASNE